MMQACAPCPLCNVAMASNPHHGGILAFVTLSGQGTPMIHLKSIAAGAAVLWAAFPAHASDDAIDSATNIALDHHIESTMQVFGTVGASVAILRDGDLVYENHFGVRNREGRLAPNGDTAYTIWSMTKLFFNVELLRAVEAGSIDLDATLGETFEDLPESWRPITLRQAYSHISGLPDIFPAYLNSDEATAIAGIVNEPMLFEPGSRSEYNQTNFSFMRQHLEAVTGEAYSDLLFSHQIEPLELRHTSFSVETAGEDQAPNYRLSRQNPNDVVAIDLPEFADYFRSSVGLHASLNDLVDWSQSLLSGTLVSRETLLEHWAPQYLNDGTLAEHTHGWELESRGAMIAIGHGGGGRVNLRNYFDPTSPDGGITVIYLDNGGLQNFNHRSLSARLADQIQPGIAFEEERLFGALIAAVARGSTADAAMALADHASVHADPTGRREGELNRIGYATLRLHGAAAAIPVFEAEALLFPSSWNSQDSLGEAYLGADRFEDALRQYQRALELDPGSERIAAIIADIQSRLADEGH